MLQRSPISDAPIGRLDARARRGPLRRRGGAVRGQAPALLRADGVGARRSTSGAWGGRAVRRPRVDVRTRSVAPRYFYQYRLGQDEALRAGASARRARYGQSRIPDVADRRARREKLHASASLRGCVCCSPTPTRAPVTSARSTRRWAGPISASGRPASAATCSFTGARCIRARSARATTRRPSTGSARTSIRTRATSRGSAETPLRARARSRDATLELAERAGNVSARPSAVDGDAGEVLSPDAGSTPAGRSGLVWRRGQLVPRDGRQGHARRRRSSGSSGRTARAPSSPNRSGVLSRPMTSRRWCAACLGSCTLAVLDPLDVVTSADADAPAIFCRGGRRRPQARGRAPGQQRCAPCRGEWRACA